MYVVEGQRGTGVGRPGWGLERREGVMKRERLPI